MPLDIKLLRDNPEIVEQSQRHRFKDPNIVQTVLKLDNKWQEIVREKDKWRRQRREISLSIGKIFKSVVK